MTSNSSHCTVLMYQEEVGEAADNRVTMVEMFCFFFFLRVLARFVKDSTFLAFDILGLV